MCVFDPLFRVTLTDFCLAIIVIDILFHFQVPNVQAEISAALDPDGRAANSIGQRLAESEVPEHVCN